MPKKKKDNLSILNEAADMIKQAAFLAQGTITPQTEKLVADKLHHGINQAKRAHNAIRTAARYLESTKDQSKFYVIKDDGTLEVASRELVMKRVTRLEELL